MYSDELTGVVIDIGNQTCRAGYAGEDTPKTLFSSCVGIIPEDKLSAGDLENIPGERKHDKNVYFTGDSSIRTRRDFMDIHETVRRGIVHDFDHYEKLIQEIFNSSMCISSSTYPLLMVEPSLHNKDQRQKICELMFEKFKVPAYFVTKSAVLSCFASGRGSALIMDSGETQTLAVPIHDGYVLQKNIIKQDFGGEYLTQRVLYNVQDQQKINIIPRHFCKYKVEGEVRSGVEYVEYPNTQQSFIDFTVNEIARDLKESACKFFDYKGESNTQTNPNEKVEYELPDGKKVSIEDLRFSIGEIFFNPPEPELSRGIDFSGYKGFHNMILESINKCDVDLRKELLSNIILTGGNTLFAGFPDAMQKKLLDIAPQNAKVKLIAYPHTIERRYSAWIGGSILSSLGSFQSMWIGKAEYDEFGSYIVEKKCP